MLKNNVKKIQLTNTIKHNKIMIYLFLQINLKKKNIYIYIYLICAALYELFLTVEEL